MTKSEQNLTKCFSYCFNDSDATIRGTLVNPWMRFATEREERGPNATIATAGIRSIFLVHNCFVSRTEWVTRHKSKKCLSFQKYICCPHYSEIKLFTRIQNKEFTILWWKHFGKNPGTLTSYIRCQKIMLVQFDLANRSPEINIMFFNSYIWFW